MPNQFAKLYTFENSQVLLTTEVNEIEEEYYTVVRTDLEGVSFSAKNGFVDEKSLNDYFDSYTEDNAKKFIELAIEAVL